MTNLLEAAKEALGWIEDAVAVCRHTSNNVQGGIGEEAEGLGGESGKLIEALRRAIQEAEKQQTLQEIADNERELGIGYATDICDGTKKKWVGLTSDDMEKLFLNAEGIRFATYIEQYIKERNTQCTPVA